MSLDTIPHASWADVYDMVYERSFGMLYHQLTEITVETIDTITKPQAKIIDFGAGTGRLSIPLSKSGYMVTAIEPSKEMLEQLKKKDTLLSVKTIVSTMQDYKSRGDQDLALCVFTVLLYLLGENSLTRALTTAYDSLKDNALFLIDIPSKSLFYGYVFSDEVISRSVNIHPIDNDLYEYTENLTISFSNEEDIEYSDTFQIKYWSQDIVIDILIELGFTLETDLSEEFAGTGSQYFIFRKTQ
jgi:SAM-dependent methyltransferase